MVINVLMVKEYIIEKLYTIEFCKKKYKVYKVHQLIYKTIAVIDA